MLNHFSSILSAFSLALLSLNPAVASTELSNLDTMLKTQESAFKDIIDGTEKSILWHSEPRKKAELAIIYIHGFSASRQELSPVTETLAQRLGANVFYTRLRGHGRSEDAMRESSVNGWKQDVKQAYEIAKQLGDKVIIISTSTGGTLATWLTAQDFADTTMANIMVSPNFGVASSSAKLLQWQWGLKLAKWINGDYNSFTPVSEAHGKYWTNRYPLEAVVPMLDLVDEINEMDKSTITTPQLLIYSPRDTVIDTDAVVNTSKEFTSAEVTLTPFTHATDHVQHVIAGVACSPSSTEAMIDLMYQYISTKTKTRVKAHQSD